MTTRGSPDLSHAEADLRAHLEELGSLEYERERNKLVKQYHVRMEFLDRLYKEVHEGRLGRKGHFQKAAEEEQVPTLDPWPEPVGGVAVLNDLLDALERFIVLDHHGRLTVALWTLHAHAHEAADVSPILLVTSPTKGCGKSTLLDVLDRLVPRPMMSANSTAAVLYRSTYLRPTFLVDEADLFLSDDRQVVNFFNSGHRRGVPFRRCEGDENRVVAFDSWCPKALAQIGVPSWPQLLDRSIVVALHRKRRGDAAQRFRKGRGYPELEELNRRAVRWSADHLEALREAQPTLPVWFDNRLADNWEPLLAIAETISEDWGSLAREAAEVLGQGEEEGREILLLRHLREIFEGSEELATEEVIDRLIGHQEWPWEHANRGRSLTGHWLAKTLRRFEIRSVKVRQDGQKQRRGYRREQFANAWARYLDPSSLRPSEASEVSQASSEAPTRSPEGFDGQSA